MRKVTHSRREAPAISEAAAGIGTSPTAQPSTSLAISSAYRFYIVAIVWLVLLFRFLDLQIISVLLEPIRSEFSLSDTQLGLLSGTVFAIFYGTLGIPVAWLADRYNRRNLVAVCLGLWSAMTALCGAATGAGSLFLARLGTGIGEAGGAPPAYSLVSDYFPAKRRSTVFAFLNSSVPAGVFAGFIVGGYINASYGWRAAFVTVGLAGVILALLVRLTVREPRRGASDGLAIVEQAPRTFETFRYLWSLRSYRHLVLGSTLFTLGAMGSGMWIASFFIRVHHMPPTQVATWLAFVYGGGGVLGALLGGLVTDRLVARSRDARWYAWFASLTTASILPFSFFVYLWPDPYVAIVVHLGTTLLMHMWMGPCYGTVQSLVGANRRAMAAAVNLLAVNLIATGAGPLIVGAISDFMTERFANESLRYSILTIVVLAYTWASLHFWLAARTLREDLSVRSATDGLR